MQPGTRPSEGVPQWPVERSPRFKTEQSVFHECKRKTSEPLMDHAVVKYKVKVLVLGKTSKLHLLNLHLFRFAIPVECVEFLIPLVDILNLTPLLLLLRHRHTPANTYC